MSFAIRLRVEPLRSVAFGAIGAAYIGVGTSFNYPVRIIHIQNLTDVTLLFSYDGIEDHFRLPRNGYVLLDITANKTVETGFFLAEGDRVYVKEDGSAPSTGTVNVTAYYAIEG